MTRMPRELDPEWFWRARAWAASWKVIALVAIGILWGGVFMAVQFIWPGPQGLLGAMAWTGICLVGIFLVLGGWRD